MEQQAPEEKLKSSCLRALEASLEESGCSYKKKVIGSQQKSLDKVMVRQDDLELAQMKKMLKPQQTNDSKTSINEVPHAIYYIAHSQKKFVELSFEDKSLYLRLPVVLSIKILPRLDEEDFKSEMWNCFGTAILIKNYSSFMSKGFEQGKHALDEKEFNLCRRNLYFLLIGSEEKLHRGTGILKFCECENIEIIAYLRKTFKSLIFDFLGFSPKYLYQGVKRPIEDISKSFMVNGEKLKLPPIVQRIIKGSQSINRSQIQSRKDEDEDRYFRDERTSVCSNGSPDLSISKKTSKYSSFRIQRVFKSLLADK